MITTVIAQPAALPDTVIAHGGPVVVTLVVGGVVGPKGEPGIGAGYEHIQLAESATWTINHNLGYRPVVSARDTSHNVIVGGISHPSVNQTVISFVTPVAGFARLT